MSSLSFIILHNQQHLLQRRLFFTVFLPPALSTTRRHHRHCNGLLNNPISTRHPLLSALDSCGSVDQVQQVHAQLITFGLAPHPFVSSKLVHLLLTLPAATTTISSSSPPPPPLDYADLVFHHTPSPNLFTYNTVIRAHSSSSTTSLLLFRSMLRDPSRLLPNQYTFAFVLNACCCNDDGGGGSCVLEADQVRAHAVRRGLETNVFVSNVLIRVYGSRGLTDVARRLFEASTVRDLFSWNSLIGAYVGSGDVDQARELFDQMRERDVISWSTVIAGYVQVGSFMEAMELFCEMMFSGVTPNEFTLTSILAACANLVALDQGRWIHVYINKARIKKNERLVAGLIDMYAKCGEINFALNVFNEEGILTKTVRPWNAMLSGFAIHGRSEEAIDLFERMKVENIAPDKVTFVSLLCACSHGKFVDEGRFYFKSMRGTHGIDPEIEHYGCMVDLFGRAGLLNEAEEIISLMPMSPDTVIWGALLGACRIHGDIEMAERIGKNIKEFEPKHMGCQVLLANIYSGFGRWTNAKHVRNEIKIAGGRKTPGCSSIDLNGMFHQFLVGDRSHPQTEQIYAFLDEMGFRLKNAGYTPELGEALLDIDEEEKETALSRHSEKLAIAFGLMNTKPGTPIRIMKNLRVCGDCHRATKFISNVYDREIIVRDRIRFHHFRGGSCSCNDYW